MSAKALPRKRLLPAFIIITCTLGLLFTSLASNSAAQDEKKDPVLDKQQKEVAELQALVKELQKKLLDAKTEEMKLNDILAATEAQVRQLQKRNAELEGVIRQIEANVIKKGGPAKAPLPLKLNPPAAKIKGTVEKINPKDVSLAEISVGAEAGLEVGHTLEVFRLQPTPRYLGTMRIVAVTPTRAVGQFFPPTGAIVALRAGDQVASELKK
jgi:hypothetical protein